MVAPYSFENLAFVLYPEPPSEIKPPLSPQFWREGDTSDGQDARSDSTRKTRLNINPALFPLRRFSYAIRLAAFLPGK